MAPPPAPIPSNAEVVRLGPKLSSAQPTGTCIIANAKNQYPEAAESWAEVANSSVCKGGASTARNAR